MIIGYNVRVQDALKGTRKGTSLAIFQPFLAILETLISLEMKGVLAKSDASSNPVVSTM